MTEKNPKRSDSQAVQREDRLKAALKANMAKRKAQKRARSEGPQVQKDSSDG